MKLRNLFTHFSHTQKTSTLRARRSTYLVSIVTAVGVGVTAFGASPAQAILPNYDPGVMNPAGIAQGVADCTIVLFEHINYHGKKICAPKKSNTVFSLEPTSTLNLLGADGMNWSKQIGSVQVRPGADLALWDLPSNNQPLVLHDDVPDLATLGWKDRATHLSSNLNGGTNPTPAFNVAANKPVTTINASMPYATHGKEKAVDTSVANDQVNQWVAKPIVSSEPITLQVDLGQTYYIEGVVLHSAGDGPLNPDKTQRQADTLNTRTYNIRFSLDGQNWETVGNYFNGKESDVTNHRIRDSHNGFHKARYVRLDIVTANHGIDNLVRLKEFEVLRTLFDA